MLTLPPPGVTGGIVNFSIQIYTLLSESLTHTGTNNLFFDTADIVLFICRIEDVGTVGLKNY